MARLSVPFWNTSARRKQPDAPARVGSAYLAQIIRDIPPRPLAAGGREGQMAYAQRKKGAPERHARNLDKSA